MHLSSYFPPKEVMIEKDRRAPILFLFIVLKCFMCSDYGWLKVKRKLVFHIG